MVTIMSHLRTTCVYVFAFFTATSFLCAQEILYPHIVELLSALNKRYKLQSFRASLPPALPAIPTLITVPQNVIINGSLNVKKDFEVQGDLTIHGKIINALTTTDKVSRIRIITGTIDTTTPQILSGTGFSIKKIYPARSVIEIAFNQPFSDNTIPIVLLSTCNSNNTVRTLAVPTNKKIIIDRISDGMFQFVVIGEDVQ